jgi:hypothetical protein
MLLRRIFWGCGALWINSIYCWFSSEDKTGANKIIFLQYLIIAVQIGWNSWRMRLISLAYGAAMCRFQNQVHRKAAEIAEGCFLLRSNREGRLDHKPHAFDNRLKLRSMAQGFQEIYILIRQRAFIWRPLTAK